MSKIRLLLLDDNPSIRDRFDLPSLGTMSANMPPNIMQRNFEVNWIFDFRGGHHFLQYTRKKKMEFHRGNSKEFYFPHLWCFDYNLHESSTIYERFDRDPDWREEVISLLPKLDGRDLLTYCEEREKLGYGEDIENVDDSGHPGRAIGTHLQDCFWEYPCIDLPRTATPNWKYSIADEYLNNDNKDRPFDHKNKGYTKWPPMMAHALPRLRNRIKNLCDENALFPRIGSLMDAVDACKKSDIESLRDMVLGFQCGKLFDETRLEGLFLDVFYDLDSDPSIGERGPVSRPPEYVCSTLSAWLDELIELCADVSSTELGQAISLFETFKNAYESELHITRRQISTILAECRDSGEFHLSSEHESKLHDWGVPLGKLRSLDGDPLSDAINKLELSPIEPNMRILDSIKDAARDGEIARLVVLALAVYAEQLVLGASDRQRMNAMQTVLEALVAPSKDDGISLSIDCLRGVFTTDIQLKEINELVAHDQNLDDTTKSNLYRQILGEPNIRAIQSATELQSDSSASNDNDKNLIAASRKLVLSTLYDLLAPLPSSVLMWRDLPNGAENRIVRPLSRLNGKDGRNIGIRPAAILNGEVNIGKDKIFAQMIANRLNLSRNYWPNWLT